MDDQQKMCLIWIIACGLTCHSYLSVQISRTCREHKLGILSYTAFLFVQQALGSLAQHASCRGMPSLQIVRCLLPAQGRNVDLKGFVSPCHEGLGWHQSVDWGAIRMLRVLLCMTVCSYQSAQFNNLFSGLCAGSVPFQETVGINIASGGMSAIVQHQ